MERLFGLSVLVLTTVFGAPLHAAPDEIRIVRGTLVQDLGLTGVLNVEGTFGVRIDAALNFERADIGWGVCDLLPCLPGDWTSLSAFYGTQPPNFAGSGQVTVQGQTYSLFDDAIAERLVFDGAFVLPEFTNTVTGTVEVSAPFAFSGSLQVPNRHESGTHDVFKLRGSGVATVTLLRHSFLTRWLVVSVRYDFVPRRELIPR